MIPFCPTWSIGSEVVTMLDVHHLRSQFPALNRVVEGRIPIFLDGPGGTQVPQRVIDALVHYLSTCNSNTHGGFRTSQESDAQLLRAHESVAAFLNAPSPDEIVFGQNMTSLTFALSRSLARTWQPGDEVVVTRLDHSANVSPWQLAAHDSGASVRFVDIRPDDCTLDLDDFRRQLTPRTRLVAFAAASNAVGSVNDVALLARLAHDAGALVFVDAVHYAPHRLIDVQGWDCDFLACSAYKFFGPHVGILWGRRRWLEELHPYKVRPASDSLPERWMTGTQNHEGLAGVAAGIDYLAGIAPPRAAPLRARLEVALHAIRDHETRLATALLEVLNDLPPYRVWGIVDPHRSDRVATFSVTHRSLPAEELARRLARHEIYAWHGNFYALDLLERLGVEEQGGFLRLGVVHYNTTDEIERLGQVLEEIG
jgi:cysteine desulfurase family protein (TIGR01976 family)